MADEAAAARLADKNLSDMLKIVHPLKDSGFDKWEKEMTLISYRFRWDESLLALDVQRDPDSDETVKQEADRRNAYTVIRSTTEELDDLLDDIPMGEAQAAFQTVSEHFHRNTTLGFSKANLDFHSASMQREDVDITGFKALISRRAKRLVAIGGHAGEKEKISVLLSGLLPEFKDVKVALDFLKVDELSFNSAYKKLYDFAVGAGIQKLRRAGSSETSKTFALVDRSESSRSECRQWKSNNCKYGDRCKFAHVGPGGLAPRPADTRSDRGKFKPRCLWCGDLGHFAVACPLKKQDEEKHAMPHRPASVHFAAASEDSSSDEACSFMLSAAGDVDDTAPKVMANSYFASSNNSTDYEWCSDTGTNRFVTNDMNDFVKGTVVHVSTRVSVGGGYATSPCEGTIVIRSRD